MVNISNQLHGDGLGETVSSVVVQCAEQFLDQLIIVQGKAIKGATKATFHLGKAGVKSVCQDLFEHGGTTIRGLTKNNEALAHVDVETDAELKIFCDTFKKYHVPYNVEYLKEEGNYRIMYHAKQADIAEIAGQECTKHNARTSEKDALTKGDAPGKDDDIVKYTKHETKIIQEVAAKYDAEVTVNENFDKTYTATINAKSKEDLNNIVSEVADRIKEERQEAIDKTQTQEKSETKEQDTGDHDGKDNSKDKDDKPNENGEHGDPGDNTPSAAGERETSANEEVEHITQKDVPVTEVETDKAKEKPTKSAGEKAVGTPVAEKTEKSTSAERSEHERAVPEVESKTKDEKVLEKSEKTVKRASDERRIVDRLKAADEIAKNRNAEIAAKEKDKVKSHGDR